MNTRFPSIPCLIASILLIAASAALAQNQLGDGRALDNNLQQGSGGRNSPQLQNTAGRYADALVTGNVAGLGAFRGNVGYGSDYAFRGTLGSDASYNFNRIAGAGNPAYATPGSIGMLNSVINPLYGSANTVLRNSTGYSAGEISGQYTPYGPVNSAANRYSPNLGSQRTVTYDQAQAYSAQPLAVGTDATGRQMTLNASPLTGLTIQHAPLPPSQPPQPLLLPGAASRSTDSPTTPATSLTPHLPESPTPDTNTPAPAEPFQLNLGERIGEQLIQSNPAQAPSGGASGTVSGGGVDQSLDKLLGSTTAKPGEDVYADLLKRIHDSSQKSATRLAGDAQRPAPQTPNTNTDNQSPSNTPGGTSGNTSGGLDRTLQKLDYNLPPMTSFAGSAQSLHNDAMTEAERYMRDERYFDAHTAYSRAVSLQPDKPLAYVGRVNADLGAGLFLSAGHQLRALFNAHPELIAARYAQPLLPPDKRLADLTDKLNAYLKADTRGSDGPLLLAYIAYQQQNSRDMTAAFDIWLARDSHDSLLPLLKRIWLPQPSSD
ncbi:MAG: tetratricopeptide repeat protein [Phycisphaerales bacterium]